MSAFDSIALPGGIPTAGPGARDVNPDSLFRDKAEKALSMRLKRDVMGDDWTRDLEIQKVKVEIFDLSDPKQRKAYEKLYKELLVKISRNEAAVDMRKDLVSREDGTSYWMKYVEYVEYGTGTAQRKAKK